MIQAVLVVWIFAWRSVCSILYSPKYSRKGLFNLDNHHKRAFPKLCVTAYNPLTGE
jgi:hypothetical protein